MICSKCGKENEDNAKFCRKCGSKIKNESNNLENESENFEDSQKNSSFTEYFKNNNVLMGIIIVLVIVVSILGTFAFMSVNDNGNSNSTDSNNNTTDKLSTTTSSSTNTDNKNTGQGYTYISGVPFYIPAYYTHVRSSGEGDTHNEVYSSNRGEKLSITFISGTTASSHARYMNNQGWKFKYDRSRNLYYLSHATRNGYIFDYGGYTVFIYADNLDDLHIVYVIN